MKLRGINYDVGVSPLGADRPSRPRFHEDEVRREIEIIRRDLGCNAIRITGRDLGRLAFAGECALKAGLEVWLSPALHDAGPRETLAYLARAADLAERLRGIGPKVVFVAGWELTFFMSGLVLGADAPQRMQTFMRPWRLLLSTIVKGPFNWRLNRFLSQAVRRVRGRFKGPVTYAAGPWESVDWRLFDYVALDYYRDASNEAAFAEGLRKPRTHGKPLVVTEFGCCAYQGAETRGAYGWAIVDWRSDPPGLKEEVTRDEDVQARYIDELLNVFEAEALEGAFVFTFIAPKYPWDPDPARDLDVASYALVKSLPQGRNGSRYPAMPWEPKQAFDVVRRHYAGAAGPRA
jgi:hypothetical protein